MKVCRQEALERFEQAACLLPSEFRRALERLPAEEKRETEEIRMRAGWPLSIVSSDKERVVESTKLRKVTGLDLNSVLEIATQGSAHTALERVKNGYIPVRGGHRIGLCGSGVVADGKISNLREFSSLNIRIAREAIGVSKELLFRLLENGHLQNTLILSPPGGGKTTLLRDLIRALSSGDEVPALRVGIADERGELAGMHHGLPQMNIGPLTDVIDGCPKAEGILMLLRGMNPQVIAMDEITAPQDAAALETAFGCGVCLLSTAHASGIVDLFRRPIYKRLMDGHLFRRFVFIHKTDGPRAYEVFDEEAVKCYA